MVEGEDLVKEEQAGIGNAELVLGGFGQALNLANGVVGKVANCTGSKRREAEESRRLVPAECIAQDSEGVAFHVSRALAFSDAELATAGDDALVGLNADEGVAANLLAAFNRFQQKTLALWPGSAQEGRDRGLEVSSQAAADGDESVIFSES